MVYNVKLRVQNSGPVSGVVHHNAGRSVFIASSQRAGVVEQIGGLAYQRNHYPRRSVRFTEDDTSLKTAWNGMRERVTRIEGDGVSHTQEQRARTDRATILYPLFRVASDVRAVLPEVQRVNAYSLSD